MPRLALADVTTCIESAFENYKYSQTGDIPVTIANNHIVNVTCMISGPQFNCGFPGYFMSPNDIGNLRAWCANPGVEGTQSFGFRGIDALHHDSVAVTLTGLTPYMFVFHVYVR